MYTLPIASVKPEMVVYEDIYNYENSLIVKANTSLTAGIISMLAKQGISEVALSDPNEVDMTRYRHLHSNPHFQRFHAQYDQSLTKFINLMHILETGIDFNISTLLALRDNLMEYVADGEQFLDYLYNMMPNENVITYSHCFNCGIMCYNFGKWINISGNDLDNLTIAGFLFDIGKTKLPKDILWKPDKLTPGEYTQVKRHIHMGYELLFGREFPPHVISVLIMHHERCDGTGYPARIPAERIDPFALIAAIADTYEAMTSSRAQRLALSPFQAIRVFEQQGLEAKYGKNITPIIKRIANMYVNRRVSITGGLKGIVSKIHDGEFSRPTVLINNFEYDLRTNQTAEIIGMI